jgi:REP element-mobilizing transposase RayT
MALAYFITYTTYGTWLPGSAKGRGSVDREHNVYGTPFVAPDPEREQTARDAMTQPMYTLSAPERDIVRESLVLLSQDKGWRLLAAHVRSNHVHVVIQADREPGRLMSDLKARSSRDLTLAGYDDAERRRWTRHGSTKHLFRDDDVEAKIRYTLNQQGPRMAWYVDDAWMRIANEPRTQ